MILAALLLLGPVVHYDNETLPRLMQTIRGPQSPFVMAWDRATINTAAPGGHGRLSNANWHRRWIIGDGLHQVKGLSIRRTLSVPDGKFILVWRRTERHEGEVYRGVWRWRFPEGTEVKAFMYVDNKLWLERTLTLRGLEWIENEVSHMKDPKSFAPSGRDCVFCHRDTGRHVSQLDGHQRIQRSIPGHSWYNYLSGGGQDVPPGSGLKPLHGGIFTFRPVDSSGRVFPQYRHIVRAVQ